MSAELSAALISMILALTGLIKSIASSKSVDNVVKDREYTKSKRDKDSGLTNYRLDKVEEFQSMQEIKQEKNAAKQNEINNQLFSKLNEINNNVIKIQTIFQEREKKWIRLSKALI